MPYFAAGYDVLLHSNYLSHKLKLLRYWVLIVKYIRLRQYQAESRD